MDLRSKDAIESSKQHDIDMSNILIAEFMGIENTNGLVFQDANTKEFHSIKYHSSWDWLMPVVDKIESLRDENGNAYRFTIDMGNAQIEGTNIEIVGGSCKLDTTYQAVVEFIKNQNN